MSARRDALVCILCANGRYKRGSADQCKVPHHLHEKGVKSANSGQPPTPGERLEARSCECHSKDLSRSSHCGLGAVLLGLFGAVPAGFFFPLTPVRHSAGSWNTLGSGGPTLTSE